LVFIDRNRERQRACRETSSGRAVALLGLTILLGACTNPKDLLLRAWDNRAFSALEAAVRHETSARIRDIACFDVHTHSRVAECGSTEAGRRSAGGWYTPTTPPASAGFVSGKTQRRRSA